MPRPHHNYYDIHVVTIGMVGGYLPLSTSEFSKLKAKLWLDRSFILQVLRGVLIIGYMISIALSTPHNIDPLDEDVIRAVQWVKINTDPNEYILSDNTNINIMASRRGPFAEISTDRTDLNQLDSGMLIRSLHDYQIRVVVVTKRLFDHYDHFNAFMDYLLHNNYSKIEMGLTIYVRDTSLKLY